MKRFVILTVTIAIIFVGLSTAVSSPPSRLGHVQAARQGVGAGECVQSDNNCADPSPANPADPNSQGAAGNDANGGSVNNDAACSGLNQLGGTSCSTSAGESAVGGVAKRVVSIISYIAGIIAVIMIMVSGVRYMTSGGDSAKVGAAKTALIYALIGLAVVGLTQILIHFVLSTAAGV
jgi:hypothetical protein